VGVDLEEDLKRKLNDLNLAAARNALSPQTGYIHLNYEEETRHDTIPLLENFCFSLALFRSRIAENILEGKALLEKLLVFEVDGNFPVYLHEYPGCKDRDFSLSLLPVFHWLVIDFRSALGESLAQSIEMLIGRILSHGYRMHAQRPLCSASEFRLKSYFEKKSPSWIPSTPEEWAGALITCQMTGSNALFKSALEIWHPQLCTFIGPQFQDRKEPQVTLFDLFMGHYCGAYSQRALNNRNVHLLASLIQPLDEKALIFEKEIPCHSLSNSSYSLSWGTSERLTTFLLDAKSGECVFERKDNGVAFYLTLPSKKLEGQEAIELSFFLNLAPDQHIFVQGKKATTFQLGDKIEFHSGDFCLAIEVHLESGQGQFFGHLLRANRSTQKGKNLKWETYDWQLALRTLRRSEECTLKGWIYTAST